MYNNKEEHRLGTTYYNLVIRYNLKKTAGYMFRPSLGHPQANTNIILSPSYNKLCLDGVLLCYCVLFYVKQSSVTNV
jgi:hypothetical protein